MTAHMRSVAGVLSPSGLWDTGFQFGDWLDPDAPADDPGKSKAPVGSRRDGVRLPHGDASWLQTAELLGEHADAAEFAGAARPHRRGVPRALRARTAESRVTVRPAYALAIAFGLLDDGDRQTAGDRLAELVRAADHRISTGFAGTPFVNDALTVDRSPRRRLRPAPAAEAPSWLYAVTMGATTIWERWDSMLPDGSINPGEMTSFNHYAFGAVADWMHRSVGGLAPLEARVSPHPRRAAAGRRADVGADEPRDPARAARRCGGTSTAHELRVEVTVPEGAEAVLRLPGPRRRDRRSRHPRAGQLDGTARRTS